MQSKNLNISKGDLEFIRSLPNFDLTMFLSELSDHGIDAAIKLLTPMRLALAKGSLQ